MIIKLCSKPQQFNVVTPTPLAHRIQSCMRSLALDYDTPPQASRGGCPTSTRWSLSLTSDKAGLGKTFVKPSATMNLVPIQSTVISSNSTASLALRCRTRICLERSPETGFTAIRLALLLSPHSVFRGWHAWRVMMRRAPATTASSCPCRYVSSWHAVTIASAACSCAACSVGWYVSANSSGPKRPQTAAAPTSHMCALCMVLC